MYVFPNLLHFNWLKCILVVYKTKEIWRFASVNIRMCLLLAKVQGGPVHIYIISVHKWRLIMSRAATTHCAKVQKYKRAK